MTWQEIWYFNNILNLCCQFSLCPLDQMYCTHQEPSARHDLIEFVKESGNGPSGSCNGKLYFLPSWNTRPAYVLWCDIMMTYLWYFDFVITTEARDRPDASGESQEDSPLPMGARCFLFLLHNNHADQPNIPQPQILKWPHFHRQVFYIKGVTYHRHLADTVSWPDSTACEIHATPQSNSCFKLFCKVMVKKFGPGKNYSVLPWVVWPWPQVRVHAI